MEDLIISKINANLENSGADPPLILPTHNHTVSFWDSDDEEESVMEGVKIFNDFSFNGDRTMKIFENYNFFILKKLFKAYNTALPSSGAVERLFSTAKLALTPSRCQIKDNNFEMQLLLHINNKNI